MVADKSKAATTVVEGTCPGMGSSWISLTPRAAKAPVLASVAEVKAAHGKFVAGQEGAYQAPQWCY